ncbi:MAG: hypothetical protein KY466_09565 [Gemmatimonadetes bacterium]|nr:hypothetical protein [Gemmatimonadota bacterium]
MAERKHDGVQPQIPPRELQRSLKSTHRLRRPAASRWTHVFAAAWVTGMLSLGVTRPEVYQGLLQEDRFIEWWTVALFGVAGFLALRLAWRERRPFDALVGAFCVFVAGEEFSWGQRLLGITPPDAFLEHNRQQELTIHNFADIFGEPRWVLMLALAGFGLVIPAIAATRPGRAILARAGATAVPLPTAAWLLAAVALLWWYPLTLTGEWVEALAGGLFLVAYAPGPAAAGMAAGGGAAVAVLLTLLSGARGATDAELACARTETAAIADDLAYGVAATGRLAGSRSVHKRVFTAIEDGYVRAEGLEAYRAAACGESLGTPRQRAYAVDPWGTAYWLSMERGADAIHLVVYSFGPNRRRDGPPGRGSGDDVAAALEITP